MWELSELLERLTQIHAVSGYEDDMIQFMHDTAQPLADQVSIDAMGNVTAVKQGSELDAPRVMLFAHMDEVGFMVRKSEADGRFRMLGLAAHAKALPAHDIQIRTFHGELLEGVVALKSDHLTTATEWEKTTEVSETFAYTVDNGQKVQVEVGHTVCFAPRFRRLPNGFVSSKSLDNRVGCCILLEVLRRLQDTTTKATLAFVGTVQEEISCDGALSPAQNFGANLAIAIDGTVCYDTPDTPAFGDVFCGQGPVITRMLRSRGLNSWSPHPKLALLLEEIAQQEDIPTQRDAVFGLMTDAKPLRLGGIPSALIGIPMRGKHTPAEVVSLRDVEAAIQLVVAFVQQIDSSLDLRRGHPRQSGVGQP